MVIASPKGSISLKVVDTHAEEVVLRLLPVLTAIVMALASPMTARAAAQSDLNASFLAAFGHRAPLTRQTYVATFMSKVLPGPSGAWPLVVQLTPARLIPLDGSRWALIVKETVVDGDHLMGGAIAIAYLRKVGSQWHGEQVWPEVFYSGSFGQLANAGGDVKTFGAAPLYFATGQWCGQETCSDDIDAVSLDSSGPRYLGDIDGSAQFPMDPTDPDAANPYCESYAYTAKVEPPTIAGAVFSVVYEGWRAPPAKLAPKTAFHHVANMVAKGGKFAMQPGVPLPGSCQ